MAAAETLNPWQDLMQTCVLGSGRRQTEIRAQGQLGDLIADLEQNAGGGAGKSSSPEEKLLIALAATSLALRAGQVPANASALPAPPPQCPEETSSQCGPYSLTLLNQALADQTSGGDGRRISLVRDWLTFCREQNKIIAFDYLPRLLDFASTKTELHNLVADCGGNHFLWLLDLNQQWKAVFKNVVPGVEMADALVETAELGLDNERYLALKALREIDGERARNCMIALWEKEPTEQRLVFLRALEAGLSLADEPFLEETALEDRRKEVRRFAANLLAKIPGSRFLARMQDRAAAWVKVSKKDGLEITLPATFDPTMARDEIEETSTVDSRIGQKAGWIYQIVSRVNPSFWYAHTGLSAGAFLQAILASGEWSLPMVLGILNATALFCHDEFQDAIISFEEIHLSESVPGKTFLTALPPAKLEKLVLRRLPSWAQTDRKAAPRLDLWYYLELVDFKWSEAFSLEILRFIIKEIKEKVPVFGHTFYSNAGNFGLRMHVSAGKHLDGLNLASDEIDTWARNGLERFVDTVKLRCEMHKSFNCQTTSEDTETGTN